MKKKFVFILCTIIIYLFYSILDPIIQLPGPLVLLEYIIYATVAVIFFLIVFNKTLDKEVEYKDILIVSLLVILVYSLRLIIESRFAIMGMYGVPFMIIRSFIFILLPMLVIGGIINGIYKNIR